MEEKKMVTVWVKSGIEKRKLSMDSEETLLTGLQKNGIMVQAPCNGRGTCGKCKVIIEGRKEPVLCCQTYPKESLTIEAIASQAEIQVLDQFQTPQNEHRDDEFGKQNYGVVIDLGTTTVVIQLYHWEECLRTVRKLNPQSSYGADVISRITAANEGADKQLAKGIRELIDDSIHEMCYGLDVSLSQLDQIVLAGNTTMIHLLLGMSTKQLGKYPFQPVSLELMHMTYDQVFGTRDGYKKPEVVIFPGVSAFVGGDIIAGLYALDFYRQDKVNLLVDLGTNGEIAIGNKEKILTTSTAAGPAFEGGNISCGCGSIPGAIKEVELKKNYTRYTTIDNKQPIGICGSGAIDLLAELWKKDYVDSHGTLKEEYRENGIVLVEQTKEHGTIRFTQDDIRQMQLAKGAIRAGIEVLMHAYGINCDQIHTVYLAGGMGFSLNVQKAARIGLLPNELVERVQTVGNSCLGGVIKYLKGRNQDEILQSMLTKVQNISLAEESVFSEKYLQYMEFQG